jgi:hypothetical protein
MTDIQKMASLASPVLTPLGPAAVLVQGLHDGLTIAGMDSGFAWFPAIMSGTGMELTGFLASKMTVQAIKNSDWRSAAFAAVGIVGYIWFAVSGIANVPNSAMFRAFVGMSTIAYFVYAVYEYITTKGQKDIIAQERAIAERKKQLDLKEAEQKAEIEYRERLAKIEADKQKAEHQARLDGIRLAKVTTGQKPASSGRPVDKSSLDPAVLAWVRTFYADPRNSGKAAAAMVGVAGCPFTSRETARKYKAAL